MSWIVWSTVTFLTGLVIFLAVPVLVGPAVPVQYRKRIGEAYFGLAMSALRRAVLVRRLLGGYSLLATKYDSEKQGEKATLDGEEAHLDDPLGARGWLHKKPFALNFEESNAIVDPLIPDLGEHWKQQLTAYKESDAEGYLDWISLPAGMRLIDPRQGQKAMAGGQGPTDASTAETFVDYSQRGFKSRDVVEMMVVIIAFAVGFGLVFLAFRYGAGGTTGGGLGPIDVPMMLSAGMGGLA